MSKEIHLKRYPEGVPSQDDFAIVETNQPTPADGEVLVENIWMSVDPYMRGRMTRKKSYVPPFELNTALDGHAIGRVVQSNADGFAKGDLVSSMKGWRSDFVASANELTALPDTGGIAPEVFLSVLGMTGMTAWVGLNKIAECKPEDVVFVSAAAGAVGSVVCQLAKAKGCFVIGATGDKDKAKWLKSKLGVDAVVNYRDVDDLSAALGEAAPNGIDVYFENVGGTHLEAALDHVNQNARIAVCGMIAHYNTPQPGPNNLFKIIAQRVRMQGFIVSDNWDSYSDFVAEGMELVRNGKLKHRETVVDGIDNAPQAFIDLFSGKNTGKMLVKLAD